MMMMGIHQAMRVRLRPALGHWQSSNAKDEYRPLMIDRSNFRLPTARPWSPTQSVTYTLANGSMLSQVDHDWTSNRKMAISNEPGDLLPAKPVL